MLVAWWGDTTFTSSLCPSARLKMTARWSTGVIINTDKTITNHFRCPETQKQHTATFYAGPKLTLNTYRPNMIIIINLIYIAQFDTNGILTALYIVITYIQMQYVYVCTYAEQQMQYVYVCTYAEQSYKHTYTCLQIHTYTVRCTNIHLPTY